MKESLESVLSLQPPWFKQRINETAIWTSGALNRVSVVEIVWEKLCRGEPTTQLRTDALDPAAFGAEAFRGGRGNIPTPEAVETLVRRRMELLPERAKREQIPVNPYEGRLLLFTPQDSLSDGAATVASEGFFDVDNVPAWDTWLYFDGHILASWVPPQLIAKVQSGIDVNPEGCIRWADQTAI